MEKMEKQSKKPFKSKSHLPHRRASGRKDLLGAGRGVFSPTERVSELLFDLGSGGTSDGFALLLGAAALVVVVVLGAR